MSRGHADYEESVSAYVLGALPELEAAALENHAAGCDSCRGEIERLRVAVRALQTSVPPSPAPPELKDSVMRVVRRDARANRRHSTGRAGPLPQLRLPRLRPAFAASAAALLLGVGIAIGAGLASRPGGEAHKRTFAATVDRARLPGASASVVIPRDGDAGAVLRVHGMPRLAPGRIYEAWVERGDGTVPVALFGVGSDGEGTAALPRTVSGADAVLVTRERSTGARAPTEKPVLSVALS